MSHLAILSTMVIHVKANINDDFQFIDINIMTVFLS